MLEIYKEESVKSRLSHGVPHGIILYGPDGRERESLVSSIVQLTDSDVYRVDTPSMANMRQVMVDAEMLTRPRLYVIENGAKMNAMTQNAFLKSLEEPPDRAYYCIFSYDELGMLRTVRARLVEWKISRASRDELTKYTLDEGLLSICLTPQEVTTVLSADYEKLDALTDVLVGKLERASLSSVLAIKGRVNKDQYEWLFRLLMYKYRKRVGELVGADKVLQLIAHHHYLFIHTEIYAERLVETMFIRIWTGLRSGFETISDPVGWWTL